MKALRPIDLGRTIGLSSVQVNRFERWGLLSPAERTPAGRRRYAERHLDEILALRAMQAGYGWRRGNRVMRQVQKGDLAAALALVDEQHAALTASARKSPTRSRPCRPSTPLPPGGPREGPWRERPWKAAGPARHPAGEPPLPS